MNYYLKNMALKFNTMMKNSSQKLFKPGYFFNPGLNIS
jgi:hypothetical protein